MLLPVQLKKNKYVKLLLVMRYYVNSAHHLVIFTERHHCVVENMGALKSEKWVQILALPHTSSVVLDKLLNVTKPQFPHM